MLDCLVDLENTMLSGGMFSCCTCYARYRREIKTGARELSLQCMHVLEQEIWREGEEHRRKITFQGVSAIAELSTPEAAGP